MAAIAVIVAPTIVHGQFQRQRVGVWVEGAGMYQRLTGNLKSQSDPGYGYEAQVRVGRGSGWTIGVGVDYVQHERAFATFSGAPATLIRSQGNANFVGAFIEPRASLGDPRNVLQPYLGLRAGYARATAKVETNGTSGTVDVPITSFTWNGTVGARVRIVGPLLGDISVGGGLAKWKSDDDDVPGERIGDGKVTGSNVTARIGIMINVF